MTDQGCLWTIGHSNHSIEEFLDLLRLHKIEVVADVRSQPHPSSPYTRQFGQLPLRQSLKEAGFDYAFLGKELGGRPPEPEFYGIDKQVNYELLAQTTRFRNGLDRLVGGLAKYRVAMMCSEEDPSNCHRRRLVTFELQKDHPFIEVTHIRGTGELVEESQFTKNIRGRSPQISLEDVAPEGSVQAGKSLATEFQKATEWQKTSRTPKGRRMAARERTIDQLTCKRCGSRSHKTSLCPDNPHN